MSPQIRQSERFAKNTARTMIFGTTSGVEIGFARSATRKHPMTTGFTMSKYEIAKQYSAGYVAGLTPLGFDESKGPHWLAGYTAGYDARAEKNRQLNEYLVSIGEEPIRTVTLC